MEYIKKVDLLSAAVEVEYLGRPRLMISAAKIGQMPSIEAVPMEYHNKVCEELARRHQAEILELTKDRQQGEWIDAEIPLESGGSMPIQACSLCKTFYPLAYTGGGHRFCPNCGAKMKGADDGRL